MKNKHIFIPLFVFLGAGLVSLVASIIDFKAVNPQLSYTSETIQFNFDGASDGTDPNGNAFDAVNFMTDDVITAALTKSNLSGEKYDIKRVRQYISIENVVPKNIVEEINSYESLLDSKATANISSDDYHPVRYSITIYQDLDSKLSSGKLKELLNNLVTEYISVFDTTYRKVFNKDNIDQFLEFDGYDYSYQTQLLNKKLESIMMYSKDLYIKHSEFNVDGRTFNDVFAACGQLTDNIKSVESIINYLSITKDKDKLKDYLNYSIKELEYDQAKYTKDLNDVTTLLASYEKDSTTYVGNGETVITVSTNSGETYDALLAKKIELDGKLAEIDAQIDEYQLLLAKVDSVSDADRQAVETRITAIKTSLSSLEDRFITMLGKYNEKYMGDDVITKGAIVYKSGSLFSSAFILDCIKIAAPIMLTVMLGIAIYYLSREIRKQKKAA